MGRKLYDAQRTIFANEKRTVRRAAGTVVVNLTKKIKIAPSLLASDFSNLQKMVELAVDIDADMLHIDIMDGVFVPSMSIGAVVVEAMRPHSNIWFDVHLMIARPEQYICDYIRAGADSITISYEATDHIQRAVQMVKDEGKKVCVGINPGTPVNVLEDIVEDLDMALIMSVNPGFGGQEYIPFSGAKLRRLSSLIESRGLNTDIQIDGGVRKENVTEIVENGANVIVAGTAVFRDPDPYEAVRVLRERAKAALKEDM